MSCIINIDLPRGHHASMSVALIRSAATDRYVYIPILLIEPISEQWRVSVELGFHPIVIDRCGPMTNASRESHDGKDPTMTFPLDQVTTIAGTNRQLAVMVFDIARTAGARQADHRVAGLE
jgi:hypothetical protein